MSRRSFIMLQYQGDYRPVILGAQATYPGQRRLLDTLADIADDGVDVELICCNTGEAYETRYRDVRLTALGIEPYGAPDVILDAVRSRNPTDVLCNFPHPGILSALARHPARVIASLADSTCGLGPRERVRAWKIARALNHRGIEWVGNHNLRSCQLLMMQGVDPSKLIAWDFQENQGPFPAAPDTEGIARDARRLVYAGGISDDKGIGDLVDAIALLDGDLGDIHLVVAGAGDLDRFRDQAQRRGVTDRVQFLGSIPRTTVLAYMASSLAVVVPSRHAYPEGLPNVIYEAVSARSPLITSDHPMFTGHLVDGRTAVVVRERSPQDLADGIGRLARDPALADRLRASSADTWSRLQIALDWDQMVRRWIFEPDTLATHSMASGRYERALAAMEGLRTPVQRMVDRAVGMVLRT